jgi:hypothetical protein
MNEYNKLLSCVFNSLSGINDSTVLRMHYRIPSKRDSEGILNSNFRDLSDEQNAVELPADETFLENALSSLAGTNAACVFVTPPIIPLREISDGFRNRFGNSQFLETLIETLVRSNSTPSVFAFLLPVNFLGAIRNGSWRREFFPNHSAVVIEHPQPFGETIQFATLQFATVIFSKNPGPIRFFKVPAEELARTPQRKLTDLARLLRIRHGETEFGFVYSEALDENYPTSFDFYSAETKALRKQVSVLGEKVPLSQIADILRGAIPINPEINQQGSDRIESYALCIRPNSITVDGRIDLTDLDERRQPCRILNYLEDGDICVWHVSSRQRGLRAGVFVGDGRQITVNFNVIIIRPKAILTYEQRLVLLAFLRSPLAMQLAVSKQIGSTLNGDARVSPALIRDFPVPIADQELAGALRNLEEAKAAFQKWFQEIDESSSQLFINSDLADARRNIQKHGKLARQRYRAATQVEELDYRIRTQYPYPLAHAWRGFRLGGRNPLETLSSLTRLAEIHTCFLAQLAILLGRETGKRIGYLDTIASRLQSRGGGTNFGDWRSIVKEVNQSSLFRNLPENTVLSELTFLVASDSDWESSTQKLMAIRNDISHQRIDPGHISIDMISEAMNAIDLIFKATEFLTDYRFVLVTNTTFDSIKRVCTFQFRDLSGDNQLVPLQTGTAGRMDLETGSLYLRDRNGHLNLLRPMLHYLECPNCHQMSTFYLDTYNLNDIPSVGLKSIERNSVRTEMLVNEFRHVGMLK